MRGESESLILNLSTLQPTHLYSWSGRRRSRGAGVGGWSCGWRSGRRGGGRSRGRSGAGSASVGRSEIEPVVASSWPLPSRPSAVSSRTLLPRPQSSIRNLPLMSFLSSRICAFPANKYLLDRVHTIYSISVSTHTLHSSAKPTECFM